MSWYVGLVFALTTCSGLADLQKDIPWLAGVTTNSVYVCAEATNNTEDATVEFGLTDSYGSSATTENAQETGANRDGFSYWVHNIKLTGLAPNTKYHYRVTHGAEASADYTFQTAPLPGTAARWGFAADCRGNETIHNAIAGKIDSHDPNMMVYGGDIAGKPDYNSFRNKWFVPNQSILNARAPFVNGTGNHEEWSTCTQTFTHGPTGDRDGYYSFDYGDAHILILNNDVDDGRGSAQWKFAAADLAASTQKLKIVAFHQPAYSYGGHGSNADMRDMTADIFEPNGVHFVLAGHNHFYQHVNVNGIHHMTIGSFGVGLKEPGKGPSDGTVVHSEKTYCYGIFDDDGAGTLTLRTYRYDPGTDEVAVIETITVRGTD